MAKRRYRLLQEAIDRQAPFADGLEEGAEFEHDFYNSDHGYDSEKAVVAAGWVERIDEEPAKEQAKGGKK